MDITSFFLAFAAGTLTGATLVWRLRPTRRPQDFRLTPTVVTMRADRPSSMSDVLASISDAVIVFDRSGSLHYLNAAALRLSPSIFGSLGPPPAPESAVKPMKVPPASPVTAPAFFGRPFWQALELGPLDQAMAEGICGIDGVIEQQAEMIPVHLTLIGLTGRQPGDNVHPLLTAVVRDLRGQAQISRMLAARTDSADAVRARCLSLAHAVHDLRTPLTSILGFSELLKDSQAAVSDPGLKTGLETIHRNTGCLSRMIDDLLDLTKCEAGLLRLQPKSINLVETLQPSLERLGEQARGKGLDLRIQSETEVPATIVTDPARLQQVLTTLIGDRIAKLDQGLILISIRSTTETNGTQIEFRISDHPPLADRDGGPYLLRASAHAGRLGHHGFSGINELSLSLAKLLAKELGGCLEARPASEGIGEDLIVRIASHLPSQ